MAQLEFDGLSYFKNKENGLIATVESTATASKAYTVGAYFYYKGKLCKCTADIAQGGTITVGTNCSVVKLADDVNAQSEQILSGAEEDARWHLGFYLDANGDLCQVDN